MTKYLIKRILFSIFALLVVVMVVMLLVYNLTNRSVIFQTDDLWNKKSGNDRTYYEYMQYQKFGYLNFVNYSSFIKDKYSKELGKDYDSSEEFLEDKNAIKNADKYLENASVQEFIKKYEAEKYEIKYLAPERYKSGMLKKGSTPYLIAVKENNPLLRLWEYGKGFITFESKNDVKDENLKDRYIKFEKDPYSGLFAIVGSGTTHKYQLYFDGKFPYIHQNWMHFNLGTSYTKYRGQEITNVITESQGDLDIRKQQYPNHIGTDEYDETAIDFHSLTYNADPTEAEKKLFPDNYTVGKLSKKDPSMIGTSFIMGIAATLISYVFGLPIGIYLARKKDKFADHLGNIYIIFIMSVPSLAYIFMVAAFGTRLFGLPYKFANATVPILAYILPTISLALPSIGSLMKWMRRYMIDQMNSDYVKFARAEGLSESEIYRKHIARNALIFLIQGLPASILACLTGAIITERVYAVPGVGNLLTTALNGHDNGIIIACTVFYTFLSILSIILGDLLLAQYDPRISLSDEGGGGR